MNFNGMKIVGRWEVVIEDNFHSGELCVILEVKRVFLMIVHI